MDKRPPGQFRSTKASVSLIDQLSRNLQGNNKGVLLSRSDVHKQAKTSGVGRRRATRFCRSEEAKDRRTICCPIGAAQHYLVIGSLNYREIPCVLLTRLLSLMPNRYSMLLTTTQINRFGWNCCVETENKQFVRYKHQPATRCDQN